jgi:heme-degrading monooxygenase HmoA
MLTVITRVRLREDGTRQWDQAMHRRVESARDRDGWVSAQLLRGRDDPFERAIVGVWRSVEDWAAWHDDPTFRQTRAQLADLVQGPDETTWFETLEVASTPG